MNRPFQTWGDTVTGGQMRPLVVAGVAGGVGTSTWARVLYLATRLPVNDSGVYRGGVIDVLVSSNTAASTARLGPALAVCPRPPVLVVMHTVPGTIAESRSHLRKVQPHITARFDISHQRAWLEMANPPGTRVPPKAKDIAEALRQLPAALQQMYTGPAQASTRATASAGMPRAGSVQQSIPGRAAPAMPPRPSVPAGSPSAVPHQLR
ncbi:hypothetical protein SacazDRAFT_00527 [Saccharomonospora azurea NA-128]|uniref:Uncharacterized protein n=1 Tax=Saccharomonospora azurea NA-128 TaxID=882081 RepID=H8G9A0_9PSEU|nr:hypothetical protein SacazDRAFT_00527 [Saccharomonospora azurea NA-128]